MSDHDVVANFNGKQDGSPALRIIDTLTQNAASRREDLRQPRRQIFERNRRREQRIKTRIGVVRKGRFEPRAMRPARPVRRGNLADLTGDESQAAAVERAAKRYRNV